MVGLCESIRTRHKRLPKQCYIEGANTLITEPAGVFGIHNIGPAVDTAMFIFKSNSLLAQQRQRIERQRALRRNPRGYDAYERHRQNGAAQHQGIAGGCGINDRSQHLAREKPEN
jgi:hypothetical protein